MSGDRYATGAYLTAPQELRAGPMRNVVGDSESTARPTRRGEPNCIVGDGSPLEIFGGDMNDDLFESETDRLRAKYEFLLSENEGHATEVERLQGYKDEAEKFLASYRIEVERLQKAEKAWTETARIYAVNDADRHAEIERLQRGWDKLCEMHEAAVAEVERLRALEAFDADRFAQLKRAEADTAEYVAGVVAQRDELEAEVERLREGLTMDANHRRQWADDRAKLAEARAEVERLRRRGEDDQQVIETMCRKRNGLEAEVERLRASETEWANVASERAVIMSERGSEVERLRKRNNDSNYHQNQKMKEITALKGELTIERGKVERLREEVNGNLSTTRRKDAIIKELRAEAEKLRQQLQDEVVEVIRLSVKVERLQAGIKEALAYTQSPVVADLLSNALAEDKVIEDDPAWQAGYSAHHEEHCSGAGHRDHTVEKLRPRSDTGGGW